MTRKTQQNYMFELKLYDRLGQELHEGDLVMISNKGYFNFYSEVKFLKDEMIIAPFHTFCFHSFVKVGKVPEDAILSTEKRYKIWYLNDEDAKKDSNHSDFERYLTSWRECEFHLDQKSFRIEKTDSKFAVQNESRSTVSQDQTIDNLPNQLAMELNFR
jgi:hypothetical protein